MGRNFEEYRDFKKQNAEGAQKMVEHDLGQQ